MSRMLQRLLNTIYI